MVKHKTRKIRGGKYIDAGSAGCVFGEPPLKCVGEAERRSSKFISKLTHQELINSDIDKFRKIKELDPNSNYFIIPTETCLVDKASILPSDELDKCNDSNEYDSLLFMESGGKHLGNLKLTNSEYIPFFNSLTAFLEGIALLHTNNYSHFDIKPLNILTIKNRDNTFITRLIDFDLMIHNNTILPSHMPAVKSMYSYWPLELKYYIYTIERPQQAFTPAFIDNMVTRWYADQQIYRKFLMPGTSYFNSTGPIYTRGNPEIDNLSTIDYSTYDVSKVDIFSLGKTLSDTYFNLIGHYISFDAMDQELWKSIKMANPQMASVIDWHNQVINDVSSPLNILIKEMIHINPASRPSIQAVIDRYNAILPHIRRLFTEENLNTNLEPNTSTPTDYVYESPQPPPPPPPPPPSRGRILNRTINTGSRRTNTSRSRNSKKIPTNNRYG
jgi:serine/threonine protein kinase